MLKQSATQLVWPSHPAGGCFPPNLLRIFSSSFRCPAGVSTFETTHHVTPSFHQWKSKYGTPRRNSNSFHMLHDSHGGRTGRSVGQRRHRKRWKKTKLSRELCGPRQSHPITKIPSFFLLFVGKKRTRKPYPLYCNHVTGQHDVIDPMRAVAR